jgi:hypothetical protein
MNITALIPNMENATSMYRGMGVLQEIPKLDSSVNINYPERTFIPTYPDMEVDTRKIGFSFLTAKGSDLIYSVRPIAPPQMTFFDYCRKYNTPIITDWDDNLEQVPYFIKNLTDLQYFDYASNMNMAFELSTHVTVSTKTIKDCFHKYIDKITVVRNAFDNYCYKLAEKRNKSKIILWRGSYTHFRDLGLHKNELIKLITENEDYRFCFWTEQPTTWIKALPEEFTNVFIKPTTHPFDYWEELQKVQPELMITPLEDNIFNRCKSDIAKLEAICVGALAISPPFPEWQWQCTPGYYLYQDKFDFFSKTNALIDTMRKGNDDRLDKDWEDHLNYVKENRLLSQSNKKRLEIFNQVLFNK